MIWGIGAFFVFRSFGTLKRQDADLFLIVMGCSSEGIGELASRLASSVRNLREIDVESVLEAQIISQLLAGKRTIPELAKLLYDVDSGDPEYDSCYMKIRRSLQNLSSKGYTSCPLFGKNRAHKLTTNAVAKLTNIGGESRGKSVRLVPRKDLVLYTATTLLGVVSVTAGVDVGFEAWTYVVFAFLLGVSANNGIRTFLKVV